MDFENPRVSFDLKDIEVQYLGFLESRYNKGPLKNYNL